MKGGPRSPSQRWRAWYRATVKVPLTRHQWGILIAMWVVSFGLGVWGYWIWDTAHGDPKWLPSLVYRSLQLFTFKGGEKFILGPWQLEVARWTSPAIAAYTAAKGLVGIFYQQIQLARASLARNHVVVCGLSDKGHLIASSFLRNGDVVVIIERDNSRGKTAAARAEGAIVIAGDANEPAVLRAAGIDRASYLIATCDDETNAEVVHQARALHAKRRRQLDCLAHVSTAGLHERLLDYEGNVREPGHFNVRFFNLEKSGARALVSQYSGIRLDSSVEDPGQTVLVCGGEVFADHFLEELAQRWALRTAFSGQHMTVIPFTASVAEKVAASQERTPALWANIDVLPADPSPDVLATVDVVFVLEESPSAATITTIDLLEHLSPQARVVIRHQRQAGLARILEEGETPVEVFSLYEDTCAETDLLLGVRNEALARLIHERFRANNPGAMGPWESLSEGDRAANRDQADWIERMLEDVDLSISASSKPVQRFEFSEALVNRLADTEHRRWSLQKLSDGWVYGAEKSRERRTHPDLVPFTDLPQAEQDKDREFVRDWASMLADDSVRFEIYRA